MKGYFLLISMIVLGACNIENNAHNNEKKLTKTDSIWLKFAEALESKDINYLIKNSLDTISCFDCNIDSDNEEEYFNKEFIFQNYIDRIMHIDSLSKRDYSSYCIDNNRIKIVYSIYSKKSPEGKYSLIFSLTKIKDNYYFQGMIVQ
jgi:hypothetical protein